MKIALHAHNNWKRRDLEIALTPCIYLRPDAIEGVRSMSLMLTWLRFSIGVQIMWRST